MTEQRLPAVNADDGTWGAILVQYLQKEHVNTGTDNAGNGGHKNVTIAAGTATAAPLTFNSGPTLTTPAAGAVEFTSDSLYFTITTGTVRKKVAIYDDSSGAQGDLHYRDSSGNLQRVGIGSNGQVLKSVSGVPAWGSSTTVFSTTTKTSGYTITSSDTVVFANAASGAVTITLPTSASLGGYRFYIKRVDSSANTVSIAITGSDNIDGVSNVTLNTQYQAIAVVADGGTSWYIL